MALGVDGRLTCLWEADELFWLIGALFAGAFAVVWLAGKQIKRAPNGSG